MTFPKKNSLSFHCIFKHSEKSWIKTSFFFSKNFWHSFSLNFWRKNPMNFLLKMYKIQFQWFIWNCSNKSQSLFVFPLSSSPNNIMRNIETSDKKMKIYAVCGVGKSQSGKQKQRTARGKPPKKGKKRRVMHIAIRIRRKKHETWKKNLS